MKQSSLLVAHATIAAAIVVALCLTSGHRCKPAAAAAAASAHELVAGPQRRAQVDQMGAFRVPPTFGQSRGVSARLLERTRRDNANNNNNNNNKRKRNKAKKAFEVECLAAHNKWRRLHGAKDLAIDPKLTAFAQKRADHIAKSDGSEFKHPNDLEWGENLAWHSRATRSCAELVRMWYDEVELYDWREAKFSHETGHFTQLVWRQTERVGCARAFSNGPKGGVYLVCNYDPPGNFIGEERDNVLRALPNNGPVARPPETAPFDASTPSAPQTTAAAITPPTTTTGATRTTTSVPVSTSAITAASTAATTTTTTTTTTQRPATSKKPKKSKNKNKKNKNKDKKKNKKKKKNKNKRRKQNATTTTTTTTARPVGG